MTAPRLVLVRDVAPILVLVAPMLVLVACSEGWITRFTQTDQAYRAQRRKIAPMVYIDAKPPRPLRTVGYFELTSPQSNDEATPQVFKAHAATTGRDLGCEVVVLADLLQSSVLVPDNHLLACGNAKTTPLRAADRMRRARRSSTAASTRATAETSQASLRYSDGSSTLATAWALCSRGTRRGSGHRCAEHIGRRRGRRVRADIGRGSVTRMR